MFTALEKRRIRKALPQTFSATFVADLPDGSSEPREVDIDPTYRWVGSDSTDTDDEFSEYPVILLSWEVRGDDVPNEATLNRFSELLYDDSFSRDEYDIDVFHPLVDEDDPDEEVFVEVAEKRYQSELQLTPVVETKWKDGVPPQPRAEAVASELWKWVQFSGSRRLNSVGEHGERPVVVEPASSPTPTRGGNTYRVPMTAFTRHTSSFSEVIPVVQDEETVIN